MYVMYIFPADKSISQPNEAAKIRTKLHEKVKSPHGNDAVMHQFLVHLVFDIGIQSKMLHGPTLPTPTRVLNGKFEPQIGGQMPSSLHLRNSGN